MDDTAGMTESKAPRRRRILTIDCGGVRGNIPARVHEALEQATGKLARESFDFLAGTSTGAVIAGAVAAGIPAEQLVTLYRRRGLELFRRLPILALLQRVVVGHQYDVGVLRRMIREELGNHSGWRINDVPQDIMITAKGLDDGHPWYFVKDRPGADRTGGLLLADCVTASAAAPTYFAPWAVPSIGLLVDGGVGVAGNPVYQACVEAFEYSVGYRPAESLVVSLGTGRFLDRPRPTWLGSWLEWVLGELFRSPGEQQTELVQRHYGDAVLYRIDVRLPRDFQLDTVGPGLDELEGIGRGLAALVDWPAVLGGRDEGFRVGHPSEARPEAYCRVVAGRPIR
jgi:patatin-like phospholipase/acyl hydrolase